MIWLPGDPVYTDLKQNSTARLASVCVCVMCDATTMCVISLDRFVCVAWMPELSINAAKL